MRRRQKRCRNARINAGFQCKGDKAIGSRLLRVWKQSTINGTESKCKVRLVARNRNEGGDTSGVDKCGGDSRNRTTNAASNKRDEGCSSKECDGGGSDEGDVGSSYKGDKGDEGDIQ